MPDISRLVIEVDSKGVVTATGNLENFVNKSKGTEKGVDDLAKKFGAFQLVVNKLPGPLKSVASGLMGITSPATAVASAILETGSVITKFSKDSIEAFQEQEVQIVRLTAVMEATGATAWTTSSELHSMAVSLRNSTGRSTNEIMQMQSVLLGFTGITGENFERLTENMINMADVMGGSLTSSANTFGRALENPSDSLNSLTRQGFVFTEEQKRMVRQLEEAGRLQEAQVVYLEAMENAFGDAATATRNARGEAMDYALAIDDLTLAFGRLASESGFTQFIQGNIARAIDWYAGIIGGIADMSNNMRVNNAAIAAFEAGIATNEQALIALHFKIEETAAEYERLSQITTRTSEINRAEDRAAVEWSRLVEQYDEIAAAISREREEQEEINRLLGIQRELSTSIARIENEYDNTSEGKATKLEREIAKWTRLRDSTWETSTGVFEGLGDEHIRQIDAIIANLQSSANKVTKEYADWVELLSQATGYTKDQVEEWKGLATVENYAAEAVDAIRDRFLAETPDGGFIYEALGLNETDVYEDAAQKMSDLLQMMTEARIANPWSIDDASYQRALELLQKYNAAAMDKRGEKYLADLTEQLTDAGKSTYELAVKRLTLEQNITKETAQQAVSVQKQIDYITNGYDIMGEIMTSIDDALRSIRAGEGGYGQYAGGYFAKAGMQSLEGTDAGNFAQGTAQGGWIVGLINMLAGAIMNVMNSIEGADEVLNPITGMLMETQDVLKSTLLPGLLVSRLLVELGKGLNWLLNILSFGLIDEMARTYDSLVATNDERQKEEERLRALNDQYKKLFDALKEQEEYYLQQRRHLNAEWAIENYQQARQVNDMILSPHGVFSTSPEDYIIATKHPENLMGGGAASVNITIINNANATVSTSERTGADGAREVQIIVDAIVQQGLANGKYDDALSVASQRRNGKKVSA